MSGIGKKHTFWHCEWGLISAPKSGDREPCRHNVTFPNVSWSTSELKVRLAQLIYSGLKKTLHFYSFNAGLKKTQLLRSFFKKAAEKPAFTQLLPRAAFNFGKGR